MLKISRPVEFLRWAQLSIRNPVVAGRQGTGKQRFGKFWVKDTFETNWKYVCKVARTGLLFCLPLSSRHILEEEAEWMASFLCTSAMHLEGSSRSDVLPGGIPSPDLAKAWGDVWAKSYGSVLGQGPSRLKLFCLVQGHPDFTEDGFITIPHSYWVGIHQGTFSLKYKQDIASSASSATRPYGRFHPRQ